MAKGSRPPKVRFQHDNTRTGAKLKKTGGIVPRVASGNIARIIERIGLESVTVRGILTTSNIVVDETTYGNDYTVNAGLTASLFGPITFTGTVTVDGTLSIF